MKILTRQHWSDYWTALDDATYDGPGCPIGSGPSEAAAIGDLLAQLEDRQAELAEAVSRDQRDKSRWWS